VVPPDSPPWSFPPCTCPSDFSVSSAIPDSVPEFPNLISWTYIRHQKGCLTGVLFHARSSVHPDSLKVHPLCDCSSACFSSSGSSSLTRCESPSLASSHRKARAIRQAQIIGFSSRFLIFFVVLVSPWPTRPSRSFPDPLPRYDAATLIFPDKVLFPSLHLPASFTGAAPPQQTLFTYRPFFGVPRFFPVLHSYRSSSIIILFLEAVRPHASPPFFAS